MKIRLNSVEIPELEVSSGEEFQCHDQSERYIKIHSEYGYDFDLIKMLAYNHPRRIAKICGQTLKGLSK